ncbi:hypothetical protein [Streptomyces chattanoogensis]|uniref:Uncharacterized protein n=1 Tax=Streptomyces chattanoogensis TaxID=66876 RepID=A0A0N1K011_9ACTN|nr:hypothetical protein [Streptomyces chattanoogensis]AJT64394.1 hypothetical protein T261_2721 [Streptomyces lydicus]KPC66965.1 hypothetical protein ADL29_01945 [Streptomyces chattanoogensis]
MRKLRRAAVVTAVLGSVGLLGAGTAYAGGGADGGTYSRTQSVQQDYRPQSSGGHKHGKSHGHKVIIRQSTSCRASEQNVDVLGEVGILDGLLGHLHGHKGKPGVQSTRIGSSAGCNNIARF